MKVLYITGATLPSEISHSLSIMRMCQAFVDAGHDVLVTGVASGNDPRDPIEYYGMKGGFAVHRSPIGKMFDNSTARKAGVVGVPLSFKTRHMVREFRPDVIYSRLTLMELMLAPRDIPIIYEMHSLSFLGGAKHKQLLFKWLVRTKNFRRIIVTTNTLATLLREHLPGADVVVARLSAEPPAAVSADQLEQFQNAELRGKGFDAHVGYTGYLDKVGLRGTDIICRTAAMLPGVAFHIVGGDPDIVEYWKDYARGFDQHGNIYFYGYRKPSEMPMFLNSFDVVLAPLQYRPSKAAPTGAGMSPLKIPQYMSYGRPIVASDIPAHREILRHGDNALLVKYDDPHEWAGAIKALLADPAQAETMGEVARAEYEAEFTSAIRVRRVLEAQ